MTLNQILYFHKAAELQNFRLAADTLHISQPSLSRSIALLEEELRVELFEKAGRGVVLTKAGKLFLEYTGQILASFEHATEKMEELASGGGRIDIGFVFPLSWNYIPAAVSDFLTEPKNSNVRFTFTQNHTPNIARRIRNGEIDVGFGGMPDKNDMHTFLLMRQELVLITPEVHPLGEHASLPLEVLSEYPVIGYDPDSWMGKYSADLFGKLGIQPNIIVDCPDEYSIAALVRRGIGIALVPNGDILRFSKGIVIHPIKNLEMFHEIYMFWLKGRQLLPAAERFIEFMKKRSFDEEEQSVMSEIFA